MCMLFITLILQVFHGLKINTGGEYGPIFSNIYSPSQLDLIPAMAPSFD